MKYNYKNGGSTWSGNAWYQKGGQKAKQKTLLQSYLQDPDSVLTNIFEIIDPTGISSYDDVYRAAEKYGWDSPETRLEIFGALPLLGKVGQLGKYIGKAGKAFAVTPRQIRNVQAVSKALQVTPYAGRGTDAIQTAQQFFTAPVFPFGIDKKLHESGMTEALGTALKMGGQPCYKCGGIYDVGGETDPEQPLSRRERRELRHNHTDKQIKKAQMIARQELRTPWLRRQLQRPDGWVENAILEKTPIPGMNSDDFYREYTDQRNSGSDVMSSLGSAFIQHGMSSVPLLGRNVYKGLIKNPANLFNFANPIGLALDYDASTKAFVDGVLTPGVKATPGQIAAGASNAFKQVWQPAQNYFFRPLGDAIDPDDNQRFFPALAKSYINQFRADPVRREIPWHLVRQAKRDIRENRRKKHGGESQMIAPDPGGRGYGKKGFMGIKPVKQWTGRNDSRLENILEFFDPTGISSWDDLVGDIRENKGKKRNWLRTASNVLSVIPRVRALYPGIMYADDLPKYVQIAAPARAAGDASKFWRHMEDMSNGAVNIMGGDYKMGGENFIPEYQVAGMYPPVGKIDPREWNIRSRINTMGSEDNGDYSGNYESYQRQSTINPDGSPVDMYMYTRNRDRNGRQKFFNFYSGPAGSEIEKSRIFGQGTRFRDARSGEIERYRGMIDAALPVRQNGGIAVGQEMEVTPEELEELRRQGYKFEMI